MAVQSFTPSGSTLNIVVSGSSQFVTLPSTGANVGQLMVQNSGGVVCFIRWGLASAGVTAVTTDFPILPGAIYLLNKGFADTVAAIGTSGTLYITAGEGG